MVLTAGLHLVIQLIFVVRVLSKYLVLQLLLFMILYKIRLHLGLRLLLVAPVLVKLLLLNALMLLKMIVVLLSVVRGHGCASWTHIRVVGRAQRSGPLRQDEIALCNGAAAVDGPVGREGLAGRLGWSLQAGRVAQQGPHHTRSHRPARLGRQQFSLVAVVHIRLALALLRKS